MNTMKAYPKQSAVNRNALEKKLSRHQDSVHLQLSFFILERIALPDWNIFSFFNMQTSTIESNMSCQFYRWDACRQFVMIF